MPSNFERVSTISRRAGQDLSQAATQYRFGLINANAVSGPGPSNPGVYGGPTDITVPAGNVIVNTVNGGKSIGVIIGKAQFGQPIEVAKAGRTLIVAGAAFAAGASLQSDANGAAITQSGSGHNLGTAFEAATAAGDIVSMEFEPQGTAA